MSKPRICFGCRAVTRAPKVAEDLVMPDQATPSSDWETFDD